jgi:capsular polysaccharide biosynthesis protein
MDIILFKEFPVYKNLFPTDDNGRKIDIYKFENCTVTGMNLYYPNVLIKTDENLVLPLLERTMSLKSGTIYEKHGMKFEYKTISYGSTCYTPLFFFIYNTDNYFHFLYDSLPYLISYLRVKVDIPGLKLLMQYPNEQKRAFYPFITEFLEILNIHADDIVLLDENTMYSDIYVSTSYTHDIDSNLPPRNEIYEFYQNIVSIVKNKYDANVVAPQKIYVSRRTWLHNDFSNIGTNYTTRRRLVNEDRLVEKLQGDGYEEVFTEKLSTIEKILYFANATHVVGAIGGGISNVLFSPKTTKLEAIVSPTFLNVNNRFRYSLDCVDVNYNFNTEHVEKTEFKTYMRVKTKNDPIFDNNSIGHIVGEIEKIYDNKLLVSYTDGSNTGWNAQNEYKQIELSKNDVEKLDDGLNSPWEICM